MVVFILPGLIIVYSNNLKRLSTITDGWDANTALTSKGNYYSAWIVPPIVIKDGGSIQAE